MIENAEQLEQSKDWLRYMESSVDGWKHLINNLQFPKPASLDIEELEGLVSQLKTEIAEYENSQTLLSFTQDLASSDDDNQVLSTYDDVFKD